MLDVRGRQLELMDEHPPPLRPHAALGALLGEAWILRRLGRLDEELVVHDELLQRASEQADPEVLHTVGMSLARKAAAMFELGRHDETVAAVDEMVDRLSLLGGADFRAELSQGLLSKAQALAALGKWQAAFDVVAEAERQVAGAREPELKTRGALLLTLRGYCLEHLGDYDGALAAWCEAGTHFGEDTSRTVGEAVVTALAQAITLLLTSGRILADSTPTSDLLLARLQASSHPKLAPLYAPALLAKASSLARTGRDEAAIMLIEKVLGHLDKSDAPETANQTALAINLKLIALEELDRGEDAARLRANLAPSLGPAALAAFDEIADGLRQDSDVHSRKQHAAALASKAAILVGLGRDQEASTVLMEIIDRYRDDESEVIQRLVAVARDGLS